MLASEVIKLQAKLLEWEASKAHAISSLIQNAVKPLASAMVDINQYRGTHGNLRLGKSCKTPIL